MSHQLPQLNYAHDALEPVIDAKTMEIHHGKHHQGYVDKLNAALEGHSDLQTKSITDLLSDLPALPADIKTAVRNNGGGHYNHTLFWEQFNPGGATEPTGELLKAIEDSCNSFSEFKNHFNEKTAAQFGSGWGWLVKTAQGGVEIVTTANQDNPISDGTTPLFGVDVWEHAYYLNYQNRRADYLEKIWEIVNWDVVAERFAA